MIIRTNFEDFQIFIREFSKFDKLILCILMGIKASKHIWAGFTFIEYKQTNKTTDNPYIVFTLIEYKQTK